VTFGACQNPETKADLSDTLAVKTEAVEAVNALSEKEKADGWSLLFDGSTRNGWHAWQGKTDGSAWKVQDGALYLDTAIVKDGKIVGGGDLLTDSAYTNFHLSLEWKVAEKGNSGIIFLVQEDPKFEHTYHTGPEMQVLDNNGHPDAQYPKHRAGDLYDLISCSREVVKPAGQWNKAEVKYDRGLLELFLNNEKMVSTRMDDDQWKKLKAGSKFKDMPDFGAFTKGHIALQDHGNMVWFRNIKIRAL
jgi:hypothetical protein